MNGDFWSVLSRHRIQPAADPSIWGTRGTIPSNTVHVEGTTVFAFHCGDGLLVAGDHRATAGNVVFSNTTEKILELDSHSLMAIAGSPSVALEMARTLQTSFEFYRRSQLQPMSLAAKLRALSRLLKENLPGTLQGFGAVAPLFAGVDAAIGRPMIYYYDPLGAQFEAAMFAASGSGSASIKSVLHYLVQWGPKPTELPLPEAINLANRLLMTAAEFDSATGGIDPGQREFATLKLLNRNGIRSVTAEEQAIHWQGAHP